MSTTDLLSAPLVAMHMFRAVPARIGSRSLFNLLGIGLIGVGVAQLGLARVPRFESRKAAIRESEIHKPDTPRSVAASGGFLSAVGLAGRPRAVDPIAEFMRNGLVPDPHVPKGWVPDRMVTPDICGVSRAPMTLAAIAFAATPLARRAAGSHRGGSARLARRHRGRTGLAFATLDGTLGFQITGGGQIAALDSLPRLDTTDAMVSPPVSGLGNPAFDAENRRAAAVGIGADALQFDDRPGRLSGAAQAGLWNGAPATALGVGYTLPSGRLRLDAAGVTNVNTASWSSVGKTFQAVSKTFEVSTVASIPLD